MPNKYIAELNYCHLYLQVIALADIVTLDSKYIQEWAYHGHKGLGSCLKWPTQEQPSNTQRQWWQRHLRKLLFTGSRQLLRPLGKRLQQPWHQILPSAYDLNHSTLYILNGTTWDNYNYQSTTNSYHYAFCTSPIIRLPVTAQMITPKQIKQDYILPTSPYLTKQTHLPLHLTNAPQRYNTYFSYNYLNIQSLICKPGNFYSI